MFKKIILFLAFTIFSTHHAFATIIQVGDLSRKIDSDTITDSNGYEWLMWNYPETFTHKDLSAQFLDKSSRFYGWRFAGIDDFLHMISNSGLTKDYSFHPDCYDGYIDTLCTSNLNKIFRFYDYTGRVNDFQKLFFGNSPSNTFTSSSYAAFLEIDIFNVNDYSRSDWNVARITVAPSSRYVEIDMQGSSFFHADPLSLRALDSTNPTRYALVRAINVSEPNSTALFFIGILMLMFSVFRKK